MSRKMCLRSGTLHIYPDQEPLALQALRSGIQRNGQSWLLIKEKKVFHATRLEMKEMEKGRKEK